MGKSYNHISTINALSGEAGDDSSIPVTCKRVDPYLEMLKKEKCKRKFKKEIAVDAKSKAEARSTLETIGHSNSLQEKLLALFEGMKLACEHSFERLLVQSDCQQAVELVNSPLAG
ncbi:hypothetical protein V6N11_050278 [Hibiscus sabdariffa]|uniref:RNase H type-1 domain-containing protein n=1 Tax=Hibiscus sabdariffa TaxID=183260 RepID=A0ABR2TA03_9ROSI